jgi:hypothetical protein
MIIQPDVLAALIARYSGQPQGGSQGFPQGSQGFPQGITGFPQLPLPQAFGSVQGQPSQGFRQISSPTMGRPSEAPNPRPYARNNLNLNEQAQQLAAGRTGRPFKMSGVNPWLRGHNPLLPGT